MSKERIQVVRLIQNLLERISNAHELDKNARLEFFDKITTRQWSKDIQYPFITEADGVINFGAMSHASVPAGTASPGIVAATTAPCEAVEGIVP